MEIMWNGSLLKQASSYHRSNCSHGTLISFFSHLVSSAAAQPSGTPFIFISVCQVVHLWYKRERERGSYSAPEFSLYFFIIFIIHYFCFVSLAFVSVSPGCNGSLCTGLVLSLLREYKLKWKRNYRSLDTREVNFSYLQALNFTL